MSEGNQSSFGPPEQRKAPCPECRKETRVSTLFEKITSWSTFRGQISGIEEYYVFECKGCEEIFFARSSGNSEDYFHYENEDGIYETEYNNRRLFWPSVAHTPTPAWAGFDLSSIDTTLWDLMQNVYKAINNEMPVLAAIGMRTCFDRVSEILRVDTTLSFSEKLEELRKAGYINGKQKGFLEVLVDAGSAAAHRGWKPKQSQLAIMIEILEGLIRDQFILQDEVRKLRKEIPTKK